MFQKEFIIKRYLFLFVDILSLVAALVLANIIRFRELQLRDFDDLYLEVLVVSILACCFGNVVFGLENHIFAPRNRNYMDSDDTKVAKNADY